jgi:hypothetical protein
VNLEVSRLGFACGFIDFKGGVGNRSSLLQEN